MATNYPGAIDSLTNPSSGDALTSPSHSAQHANANDAIEAIETELGTDPAGASATVKARFEAIEANDWVTSARIAADAVGSSEIAANAVGSSELADNAVDTAAIADGAVTAAKILIGAATVGHGTASPEGSVTAPIGSSYLQTSGAATVSGQCLWRKTSGTGNTGWEPEGALADTGWRNVAADLLNGWKVNTSDGGVQVRRIGNTVTLRLHVYDGTVNTVVWAAPSGFRPGKSTYFPVTDFSTAAAIGGGYWATAGNVERYVANTAGYTTVTIVTDDAWPSSLPGAAA